MPDTTCGCKCRWSDELDHPFYDRVCAFHKWVVPIGWGGLMASVRPKPGPSKARRTVAATS